VQLGWAVFLGLIAIVEFAHDYRPRVEITAATAIDENDPLSTLFLITNPGRFPIMDIQFTCKIFSGDRLLLSLKNITGRIGAEAPLGTGSLERLDPGESATRDCLADPQSRFIRIPPLPDPAALRINFTAEYRWPWVWLPDSNSKYFSIRKSPDGMKLLLVPDIEH